MAEPRRHVLGVSGFSGSGKTTLIEKLVPRLVSAGLRVSLIKHAHHDFDVDQPGKDSWRHRMAGCTEVLVSSARRWALMHELRSEPEPALEALLQRLGPSDLVLVEGYKHTPMPRIEVHRREGNRPLLYLNDPNVIAIATDEVLDTTLPQFPLDDVEAIAGFVVKLASALPVETRRQPGGRK